MNNNKHIEDLFRNTLENYQSDVKPELWNAIQSKLPAGNSVGASAVTKGVVAGAKISASTIIIAASVIAITAVSVVLFNSEDKKQDISNTSVVEKKVETANSNKVLIDNNLNSIQTNNTELKDADELATKSFPVNTVVKSSANSLEKNNSASPQKGIIPTKIEPDVALTINNTTVPVESKDASSHSSNTQPESITKDESKGEISGDNSVAADENTSAKETIVEISDYFGQIPNIFTPGTDGKNDLFMVHPKNIKSFTVTIFDRAGKQIHQWNNPNGFWDGLLNSGQDAPAGIYIYVISGETMESKTFRKKGSLTLLR